MYRINRWGGIALRASRISTRALMLLLAIALLLPATAVSQELEKLNRFVQAGSTSNSAAMRVFRIGRDQIQEREWGKAAATFREFIRDYPTDKNVDAALFYLAFALKNEAKYQEAKLTLERLLKEHSNSSWKKDAEALILQMAAQSNNVEYLEKSLNDTDTSIKIIALQSLFINNPDRAAEYVAEYFKPDSKASLRLKENALHLLGQYRGKQSSALFFDIARRESNMRLRRAAIYWLGRTGDESVLPGLREMALTAADQEYACAAVAAIAQQSGTRPNELLSEIARNTTVHIEVREAAIRYLGQRSGEVIVDELMKIYNAEPNENIQRMVIRALSRRANPSARDRLLEIARSNADPDVRREAIRYVVRGDYESNVGDLISIYNSERDEEIRRAIVSALARSRSAQAEAWIAEVARTAESAEVRREAMHSLARRNPQQVIDILIQLYGTEQNVEVKREIISSLAQLAPKPVEGQPDQDAATKKLTDIARNDPAPQLRESAIFALVRRDREREVPMLIQFFDAEKSEEIKERILLTMCRYTNKQALRKLMEVAKSDASVKLRKSAVTCLGRSKDPEAMKFIEEILK
ncbi:MAG TPA: HEAT repeat domain-containing protein [Blastocatellia bacterium]|nr:HEAT repeat domain-containing protein [Blastocatellia bacterium]